jgi:hypothetical protein
MNLPRLKLDLCLPQLLPELAIWGDLVTEFSSLSDLLVVVSTALSVVRPLATQVTSAFPILLEHLRTQVGLEGLQLHYIALSYGDDLLLLGLRTDRSA